MQCPKRKLFIFITCPIPLIIYVFGLYIAYNFVGTTSKNQTQNTDHEHMAKTVEVERNETTSTLNVLDAEAKTKEIEIKQLSILNRTFITDVTILKMRK